MSRNSKIALLPRDVREQLNARLRDGETGPPLLEWLNDLPEIKELVAQRFKGVAISPANLSAWRRGGYQSWLVNRESLELAGELMADADSVRGKGEPGALTESLSAILEGKLAWILGNWSRVGEKRFEQELKTLRIVSREVARLRKGNQDVVRLDLNKQRQWNWMESYTTKQFTKKMHEWAQKSSRLSAWLRTKWPNADAATRYFLQMFDYNQEQIDQIMAEPDKTPPWDKARPSAPATEAKPEHN